MQVDEVAAFVANNARRVLGVDAAQVLPVSARAALDAKLASTKDKRGFFGQHLHHLLGSMDTCMVQFCASLPIHVPRAYLLQEISIPCTWHHKCL